jgi:hypothetical protein
MLRYEAGPRAMALLRERGLTAELVSALVAPATGPKWLAIAGLDRALMSHGWLDDRRDPLLVLGASAGAWRAAALASRDPLTTHAELERRYIAQRFTRADGPRRVSASYRELLAGVFSDDDVTHALGHPTVSLGLYVDRARRGGLTAAARRGAQMLGLAGAALSSALHPRGGEALFERTLFHTPPVAESEIGAQLKGIRVPLRADNFREALLASGTVPLYMDPVADIPGAPAGRYLDGGLLDYHLAQRLDTGGRSVVVVLLHQRRIIPGWFDKLLPWRSARPSLTEDVLLVYPSPVYVAGLPGGRVPTREDFETFIDDPDERERRWRAAARQSDRLGEQLLADIASGALVDQLVPLSADPRAAP